MRDDWSKCAARRVSMLRFCQRCTSVLLLFVILWICISNRQVIELSATSKLNDITLCIMPRRLVLYWRAEPMNIENGLRIIDLNRSTYLYDCEYGTQVLPGLGSWHHVMDHVYSRTNRFAIGISVWYVVLIITCAVWRLHCRARELHCLILDHQNRELQESANSVSSPDGSRVITSYNASNRRVDRE